MPTDLLDYKTYLNNDDLQYQKEGLNFLTNNKYNSLIEKYSQADYLQLKFENMWGNVIVNQKEHNYGYSLIIA